MKRFKIEQSTADIVSQSGLALIGQAINRYTTLTQELDTQVVLVQRELEFSGSQLRDKPNGPLRL